MKEKVGGHAPGDDILVLPAHLVAEASDGAVLASGLESQDSEGLGDDHLLHLVVGRRHTFEDLEPRAVLWGTMPRTPCRRFGTRLGSGTDLGSGQRARLKGGRDGRDVGPVDGQNGRLGWGCSDSSFCGRHGT